MHRAGWHRRHELDQPVTGDSVLHHRRLLIAVKTRLRELFPSDRTRYEQLQFQHAVKWPLFVNRDDT
jgi:hypothetical protein